MASLVHVFVASAFAAVFAGCVAAPPPASTEGLNICGVLDGLAADARASRTLRTTTVSKPEPGLITCSEGATPKYCSALLRNISIEHMHGYPWAIVGCLDARLVQSSIQLRHAYTGLVDRQKIVHLAAAMAEGVELDLRFVEADASDPDNSLGSYILTVSP